MSKRDEIYDAIRAANAAGRTEDVQKLAGYLQTLPEDEAAPEQERPKPPAFVGPPAPPPRAKLDPLVEGAKGIGDLGLSMMSGMVTSPINHARSAWAEYNDQTPPEPIAGYQPRTGVGKMAGSKLGELLAPVANAIDTATGVNAPDAPHRATGHVLAGLLDLAPGADVARRFMAAGKARSALIPTTDAIRQESRAAYDAAKNSGELLPQSAYGQVVPKVEQMLAGEGFDADLHPKTHAALNRLYEDSTRPGINAFSPIGAENTRRVLLNAENEAIAGSKPGTVSSDARLASKVVDEYDDFLDQNMPATTQAGKEARSKWANYRKSQDIEALIESAKNQAGGFTQSGMENALRTKFKQLADNPKRFGRFSPDEQAAILKVARNDHLIAGLRQLGKLSPLHGGIPATLELLAALANPATAGAVGTVAGLGIGGRVLAEALRKNRAGAVSDLVRVGGNAADLPGLLENMPAASAAEQAGNAPAYLDAAKQDRARRLAQTLR